MTKLLLFSGSIGSGKNYISNQMIQELNEVGNSIFQLSFADEIKKFVDASNGFDKNFKKVESNGWEHQHEMIDSINRDICQPWILPELLWCKELEAFFNDHIEVKKYICIDGESMTILDEWKVKTLVRHMYQILGSEIMHRVHPSVWAIIAARKISRWNLEEFVDYIVIDDFRYISELFTLQALLPNLEIVPYAITAKSSVRAKRRNCSLEELAEMCSHKSEYEFETMIKPYIEKNYPDNVIENN